MDLPTSFDEVWRSDWGLRVLEHGLPELPETVRIGESVPVARWVGPRRAAVVHVEWSWTDGHDNDALVHNVEMFFGTDTGWQPFGAMGGGSWFDPPLVRPRMSARQAYVEGDAGAREGDKLCEALVGFAGSAAVAVQVIDQDGETESPIESPLGVFVVATAGPAPATVRVLDTDRVVLIENPFGGKM